MARYYRFRDAEEIGLELDPRREGEKAMDNVEIALERGYADRIEDSVVERGHRAPYSPAFYVTAITPEEEDPLSFQADEGDEVTVLEEEGSGNVGVYPQRMPFHSPEEAMESLRNNGLRLNYELFAEDPWMETRKCGSEAFGASGFADKDAVDRALAELHRTLGRFVMDNDGVELDGFVHDYRPGTERFPTVKDAVDDAENGVGLYGRLESEDFMLKAGYLRPVRSVEEYPLGKPDETPFFGCKLNLKVREGTDAAARARERAEKLVERLREADREQHHIDI